MLQLAALQGKGFCLDDDKCMDEKAAIINLKSGICI
jgi:hypothetical protein